MPRKQSFNIKQEPEDSMEFGELFPIVHHFSFSSSSDTLDSKSPKADANIPALWNIEKGKIDEEYPEGVPPNKTLADFGLTKEEVIGKFIPESRDLPIDVMVRAEEMKEQERIYHEHFIETMLNKYPVDNSYHANKARQYSQDQDTSSDETSRRQRSEARKTNNDKSMESRYKKKVERAVNAYTIIHLRERILEYQTRMNLMKDMLLQTNLLDEQSDDLSSVDESDMESLSSMSSY